MHKNIASTKWHGIRTGTRGVRARNTKTRHSICRCGHKGVDHKHRCCARDPNDRRRRCSCKCFVPAPLPRPKVKFVPVKAPKVQGGKREIRKYIAREPTPITARRTPEMNTSLDRARAVCWIRSAK